MNNGLKSPFLENVGLNSIPIFKKLLSLELNPEDYLVFGSTPMWLYGLKDLSGDVDILARGEAWAKATQLGKVETPASGASKVVRLFDGEIEIFDGWFPGEWDVDALISNAVRIDGVRFASLEDVIEWKKEFGRVKDLEHARVIEEYLLKTSKNKLKVQNNVQ